MATRQSGGARPGQQPTALGARARGGLARTLLLVLLPLILGPLVTFAYLVYREVADDITQQVVDQLTTLAELKDAQIDEWSAARVNDLNSFGRQRDIIDAVRSVQVASGSASFVQDRLNRFLATNAMFEAVMLAEPVSGTVTVSTQQFRYDRFIGESFFDATQLARARLSPYMLPPRFEPRLSDVQLLIAVPVIDTTQDEVLGILLGFVRDEQLLEIVRPVPGLGLSGRAFVATQDGYALGSYVTREKLPETTGVQQALIAHRNGWATYEDAGGVRVYGVHRWMPDHQLAILVEQSAAEALEPLQRFGSLLVLTGLAALVVSTVGVVALTRTLITGPLAVLMEGALRMAGGDLRASVRVGRRDEIGLLAQAFNSMAGELRELYEDLERKVEARTQQLATAAEVGRAATSILNADELLAQVVELIRDRFGYYHVSVFLLDKAGRWAGLHESTGEVGAQLKARGHRLAVGSSSLIGWVTANRKPRIAQDVGGDAVYFRNELLPETRSEAALPLSVGDRLIGALDVQSRELNAFSQADIEVLQVLADQVAVAVENGRLFAHQERVAELEQQVAALAARLHRSLTPEAVLETAASALGQTFGVPKVVVRLTPPAAPEAAPVRAEPGSPPGGNGHAGGNGRAAGNDQHSP